MIDKLFKIKSKHVRLLQSTRLYAYNINTNITGMRRLGKAG